MECEKRDKKKAETLSLKGNARPDLSGLQFESQPIPNIICTRAPKKSSPIMD
jgi:hypothetical protein